MREADPNACVSRSISLTAGMYADIDREAAARGWKRSMVVREAVRHYLQRRGGRDAPREEQA